MEDRADDEGVPSAEVEATPGEVELKQNQIACCELAQGIVASDDSGIELESPEFNTPREDEQVQTADSQLSGTTQYFPTPPGLMPNAEVGTLPMPAGLEHLLLPPLTEQELGLMPQLGLHHSPMLFDIPQAFIQGPGPALMPQPEGLSLDLNLNCVPWEAPLPCGEQLKHFSFLADGEGMSRGQPVSVKHLMTDSFIHHRKCQTVFPGSVAHVEEILLLLSNPEKEYEEIDVELTTFWRAFEKTKFENCDCRRRSQECGRCTLRVALRELESREPDFMLGKLGPCAFGGAEVPGFGKKGTPDSIRTPDSMLSRSWPTPDVIRDAREETPYLEHQKGKGGKDDEWNWHHEAWYWDRKGKTPGGKNWDWKGKKGK
eukprot:g17728.t1